MVLKRTLPTSSLLNTKRDLKPSHCLIRPPVATLTAMKLVDDTLKASTCAKLTAKTIPQTPTQVSTQNSELSYSYASGNLSQTQDSLLESQKTQKSQNTQRSQNTQKLLEPSDADNFGTAVSQLKEIPSKPEINKQPSSSTPIQEENKSIELESAKRRKIQLDSTTSVQVLGVEVISPPVSAISLTPSNAAIADVSFNGDEASSYIFAHDDLLKEQVRDKKFEGYFSSSRLPFFFLES